jgi:hypothetical protein
MDGRGLVLHRIGGGLSPGRARGEWGHLWLGGDRPWGRDLQCHRNLDITNHESAEPNNVAGQVVEVSLPSGQKSAAARARTDSRGSSCAVSQPVARRPAGPIQNPWRS